MLDNEIIKFKKVLQQTIEKKAMYEKNIEELENVIEFMKSDLVVIKENDNIDTIILKAYVENGSMPLTCNYMNEKGYKVPSPTGGRKYTIKDISDIVSDFENKNIDSKLKSIVRTVYTYKSLSSYGKLKIKEF